MIAALLVLIAALALALAWDGWALVIPMGLLVLALWCMVYGDRYARRRARR